MDENAQALLRMLREQSEKLIAPRDYMAGQALTGLLVTYSKEYWSADGVTHEAYAVADAMLAARGTPAPALDESEIRKDERENAARDLERFADLFFDGTTAHTALMSAARCVRQSS